jgi:spermidine dehydrogenase
VLESAAGAAMTTDKDRVLGMDRNITRRDLLNGFALAAGASLLPSAVFGAFDPAAAAEGAAAYYPPALTGMRGSHPGSFEAAHSMRDGTFWEKAGKPEETGERYDLVIVGGGLSGLAAAHYYRKAAGASAKILIIENHDDFGGHAKRNEFQTGKAFRLGFGGTFSIESPAPYSAVAKGLVAELGIDVPSFSKVYEPKIYSARGMSQGIFFDKENFGANRLVSLPAIGGMDSQVKFGAMASAQFLAQAPLSEAAKKDLARLITEKKDYLPGLSSAEKKAKLARISYADFLTKIVGVDPSVVKVFQTMLHGLYGYGMDAVPAQDAWGFSFPGFAGMNLDPAPGKGMNRDSIPNEEAEKFFFHFPDGNATIARLLVRGLIPEAIPGKTVDDVILARADYARLDEASSAVRIRLNSTAVRVKHVGDAKSAKEVEVAYARDGKVHTVRGANCVLACWHVVIPYICEELPEAQKTALGDAAKVPIVYTNVLLRDWKAFEKLGISSVNAPGGYFSSFQLDMPVSMGGYECAKSPEEPIVVHMMRTPCRPGRSGREQHLAGRAELFRTTFETFERNIRKQLGRTLSGGGFDPARDIAAITVNRWPHGYAYQYNSIYDRFWMEGGELPCEAARKPYGRITIANADADAYAYTDCAIDQAYRAVQELRARG